MGGIWLCTVFILASVVVTIGLGRYMACIYAGQPTWLTPVLQPVERSILRLSGLSPEANQGWATYCRDLLLSNMVAGLLAFLVIRFQDGLPLNPLKFAGMEPLLAFNTVCSFVTNTNWQSYSGEQTLTNLSQMLGLTFWMIIGAGSGVSVCIAFLRGLTGRVVQKEAIGNFYQDLTRTLLYLFLPVLVLGSLFFVSQGVPQTLTQQVTTHTMEGDTQKIAMGPVATLLTIKQFGTNGGGFFNANSSHPYENPNALTNAVELMLELAIPMGLVYLFGLWLNNKKQAWLIWAAMLIMFAAFAGCITLSEQQGSRLLTQGSHSTAVHVDQRHSSLQSGGNTEGKEVRFGLLPSTLFATATTATSTGAVNGMHDSLTPLGGLIPLADMMLNVVFGGVGVGLMGFLLYGVLAVFLTGLMVGRTPELFGKKIEKPEIILASVAILLHPVLILAPTAISVLGNFGLSSLNNAGPHGLSEILYAYTSAAANNGSAFAGLNANTPWYNVSLGIVILLGRYLSIIALLAIAGSLLGKPKLETTAGTLRTDTWLFTGVWVGVILILGALTFVPVLALGPVAEHLAMQAGQRF